MPGLPSMGTFLPRAPRIAIDAEVTLLLFQESSRQVVTESIVGILCNISDGGACIEVASPLTSGFHLFYKTLNTQEFSLLIEGFVPSDPALTFSVMAMSIWMKAVEEDRPPGFRIGVQFRQRQKKLVKQFK